MLTNFLGIYCGNLFVFSPLICFRFPLFFETHTAQVFAMRLFAITVGFKSSDGKVNILKAAHELSSFGYFQRGR